MGEERLKALRREIDRIDEQLIDLLAQRLKLANDVLAVKRKLGKEVRDEARERAVISLARERAKERGLDPSFAEWVMRLTISQTAGAQMERAGVGLWEKVQRAFEGRPAQLSVVRVLLKYGLRVREDGEIACGDIRIPAAQVAREAGVDRRMVNATARRILQDSELKEIFSNLEPIAYLKGVSKALGLGVIEILPKDATRPGIISEVTGAISKFGISIRQAIADDPYFVPQPKLTIITDEPVRGEVIEALRKLPSVLSVIVY